jgi:hypothetical protein
LNLASFLRRVRASPGTVKTTLQPDRTDDRPGIVQEPLAAPLRVGNAQIADVQEFAALDAQGM